MGVQQGSRIVDGLQVAAVQAAEGTVVVDVGGLVGGERSQQVMEFVPAGDPLVDEVRLGEPVQHRVGCGDGGGGERGGRRDGDVQGRCDGGQPEQPSGLGVEGTVGVVECGPYARGFVALDVQSGHRIVTELVEECGDADLRLVAQVRRRDPQRQWQAGAAVGEIVGLAVGNSVADKPDQQRAGFHRLEQTEVYAVGTVQRDQSAQSIAAGHDHDGGRASGQERADLFCVVCVVQHDQDTSIG